MAMQKKIPLKNQGDGLGDWGWEEEFTYDMHRYGLHDVNGWLVRKNIGAVYEIGIEKRLRSC